MKFRTAALLLIPACVATGSLALFYRQRAADLQRELAESDRRRADAPASATRPRSFTEAISNPPTFITAEPNTAPSADELAGLSNQIQALLFSISKKDEVIASLRQAQTNRAADADRAWRNPTNWLEQVRKDDPQRYEEIMKAREESRQKVSRSFAEKAQFLLKRDNAKMDDTEKAEYEHMVSLLNETWLLAEKIRAENIPREQRWETMRTMRENMRTLEPLLDSERERALFDVAQQVGYKGPAAGDFVQYMNDLIEVTSMQNINREMRRGGGGGFDGRGPDVERRPPPPR